MGLEAYAKTSGSKGLQVYIPLNTPATYDETKPFAKTVARLFEQYHPELVVSDMKKSLRAGKIFVDWSQNDDYKTTVCVYSLRAKDRPTVSTPVKWEEVAATAKKSDPTLLVFESQQVLERVDRMGDLFEPLLKQKQKLPSIDELERAVAKVAGAMEPAHVDLKKSRDEDLRAVTQLKAATPEGKSPKRAASKARTAAKPSTRRHRQA